MSNEEYAKDWVEDIAAIISRAANGPVLRKRAETFLSPRPAKLADTPEQALAIEARIERLAVAVGGTPYEVIVVHGEPKRRFDMYVNAAIAEVIAVFHRARRAVVDAHLQFTGHITIRQHPDWLIAPHSAEGKQALAEAMEDEFWESAETAYIRLASYWDRVGQLLDFFFFGIRHFERDGFAAVVERIVLNLVPVDSALATAPAMKRVKSYTMSEQEDGYKWLARRRNLVVHSLHLQPLNDQGEKELFEALHNHLDVRLRTKLKPGTPEEELKRIHGQLSAACELFEDILSLCELRTPTRSAREGLARGEHDNGAG